MATKIVPKFWFKIMSDGKLEMDTPNKYLAYKQANFKPGDKGTLTIQKHYKVRSSGQWGESGNANGYYFGVILPIIQKEYSPDLTIDEIHEACKQSFSDKKKIDFGGGQVTITKSTALKDSQEFMEYLERIKAFFGSEEGIIFPDPTSVSLNLESLANTYGG